MKREQVTEQAAKNLDELVKLKQMKSNSKVDRYMVLSKLINDEMERMK